MSSNLSSSSTSKEKETTTVHIRFNDSLVSLPSFDTSSVTHIDICFCKLATLSFLDSLNINNSVVSFIVRHNKLQGASSLTKLKKLTVLHVDNNELTNVDFISELNELKTVSLNFNQLKRLPATLPQSLEHLYAIDNQIDIVADTLFPSTPNLITFALSGNRLTALPQNLATSVTKLERLVLKDNALTSLDAAIGQHLTRLSVLDVRNNASLVILPEQVLQLRRNAKRLTEVPITMQQHLSFQLLSSLPDRIDIFETSSSSSTSLTSTTTTIRRMYIGDMVCAANKPALQACSVTHVINVAADLQSPFRQDFAHLLLPMFDMQDEDLLHYINIALPYIDRAFTTTNNKAAVFVHCRQGASRSASICLAFIMRELRDQRRQLRNDNDKEVSLNEPPLFETSLHILRRSRPLVHPNVGFYKQLKEFETMLIEGRESELSTRTGTPMVSTLKRMTDTVDDDDDDDDNDNNASILQKCLIQ